MNPVKTLCFTLSLVALLAVSAAAQKKTLYFYPPDQAKWVSARSYITDLANPSKPLELDTNLCGWYKIELSATDPLLDAAQIWLGKTGTDKIGPKGKQSDDPMYQGGNNYLKLEGFELGRIFGSRSTLYLVADALDPDDETAGWFADASITTTLYDKTRCYFELAAFIYDTDPAVHPDFSCGIYNKTTGCSGGNSNGTNTMCTCGNDGGPQAISGAGGNLKGTCAERSVAKNIVMPDLDPVTRKMKYNAAGDATSKCWTNEEWFNKAFTYTKGVNVQRCYDMPFTPVKSGPSKGSYSFDSDKLLNSSGRLVGGFYPEVLNSAPNDPDCPSCNTKRFADRYPPLVRELSQATFDEWQSRPGDFGSADVPSRKDFGITVQSYPGCEWLAASDQVAIYDWCVRTATPAVAANNPNWSDWFLHGTTALKNKYNENDTEFDPLAKANQHFCFESHAKFFYDPEQKFYFSGDDPIWVFINDKLVIDLGGTHLAAPGHVDLGAEASRLGLEEGKEYPIDIFFCDQRTVNSNVRITTNIYVSSSVKFGTDPYEEEGRNYMCAEIKGGSDCKSNKNGTNDINACGPQIGSQLQGWSVDFFMLRRGNITDTIWLSPTKNSAECKGGDKDFTCYGGIHIEDARYSCGGAVRCQGNPTAAAKVTVAGNMSVFARLKDDKGVQQGRSVQIDQFKPEVHLNMVWGKLIGLNDGKNNADLLNAYGDLTAKEQWVIAGKRTPIYIASGDWNDLEMTSFSYDDPYSGLPSDAAGRGYDVSGATEGLKIYKSKTGNEETKSGKLQDTGLDTLWIEGAYTIGEKEFTLSVGGSDPLKIHIYQPKFEIRDAGCAAKLGTTDGFTYFTNGDPNPPYVGTPLNICVAAVDGVRGSLCDHCSFGITTSSTTNNPAINSLWDDGIVTIPDSKITNGTLKTSMQGWDQVIGADRAEWSVFGPSKDYTNAKWTGLQFMLPPVPMPRNSFIYDRNGDGIADSIRIEFNKSFKSGGVVIDSLLPALIEVIWADKDTVRFHHPDYQPAELKNFQWMKTNYNRAFSEKNAKYWKDHGFIQGDSLLVIAEAKTMFSKDILTTGYKDGKGTIISSTPFNDADGVFTYQAAQSPVQDRVPPIVVKAIYEYKATSSDCMNSVGGCYQRLEVHLSEMVFPIEGATTEQIKDPFSYCLGFSQAQDNPGCPLDDIKADDRHDQEWNRDGKGSASWGWELPVKNPEDAANSATYMPNTRSPANTMSSPKGDNIVNMAYYAKNTSYGTTRMPKANDWIKIRHQGSAYRDAEGNGYNPREIGVPISGTNPSKKKQITITTIIGGDPNAPTLGGAFGDVDNLPPWINPGIIGEIGKGGKDELFKCDNKETCKVAELLPVPPNLDDKALEDAIRTYYPGSVGTVFQGISERIAKDVDKLDSICGGLCTVNGKPLKENAAEGVTIFASADYHTNIGNYVAHRPVFGLHCKAPIFQDYNGTGDCLNNPNSTPPVGPHLYLAWNLKANSGRLVGAGAYVGISKFYWEIKYTDKNGATKTKKIGEDEFIEMYGVKRKAK